jgi:hypothetical protein
MNKPRLSLWFFVVTGALWLTIGVLRLIQHTSPFDTILDFAAGCIFLLLAWQQLSKLRSV